MTYGQPIFRLRHPKPLSAQSTIKQTNKGSAFLRYGTGKATIAQDDAWLIKVGTDPLLASYVFWPKAAIAKLELLLAHKGYWSVYFLAREAWSIKRRWLGTVKASTPEKAAAQARTFWRWAAGNMELEKL
jgi:hypothetical protein